MKVTSKAENYVLYINRESVKELKKKRQAARKICLSVQDKE